MRLLVTRPMEDGVRLAELLAARGHDVILSPLIDIQPIAAQLPPDGAIDALALTSANGVRALRHHCQDAALWAAWQAKPAFAVGPQTAALLTAYGWSRVHQAAGDVAALAQLLAERLEPKQTVLHLAGQHRAGNLAAALDAAGLKHQRAVLYEAQAAVRFSSATAMALSDADEPVDGVLLYSVRTADIFIRLMEDLPAAEKAAAENITAYCLSAAVAERLRAAGFPTMIAALPTEAAMLEQF